MVIARSPSVQSRAGHTGGRSTRAPVDPVALIEEARQRGRARGAELLARGAAEALAAGMPLDAVMAGALPARVERVLHVEAELHVGPFGLRGAVETRSVVER